jgi:Core-2/I-Branching enzyme
MAGLQIAYVVLAHHQPRLCSRLLAALVSDSAAAFVHVDAKVDAKPFLVDHPHAFFLEDRLAINRGGWSQTRALVRLMERAVRESRADYYIFLAGTDYPIKSQHRILAFLDDSHPTNFIKYYPLLPGTYGYWNFENYHFVDLFARVASSRARQSGDAEARYAQWVSRVNRWLPARRFPAGAAPFRGSTRWCLTRDTVKFLLDRWNSSEGRAYRRYFRFTWGSDEMLIQTIIFNSEAANRCHSYDRSSVRDVIEGRQEPWHDEVGSYLHFVDWDPAREDPAILDERDYTRLETSDALFACKFDEQRSERLLDLVDSRLRQEK